jgi:stress-induced morphogen
VPITADEIRDRLLAALPGAEVDVRDTTGGGDHYAARVVSDRFRNLGPVDRHRMVYGALGDAMRSDIHALALTTLTPDEAARRTT